MVRVQDFSEYFKGKKITVMGLGLLGRGVGDAKFLAEQGAELIVTDLKTEDELASSLEQLKDFSNITYRLGEHHLDDFKNRDFILKAAGVPFDSIYIEEAKKNNIPVKMSASWFVELAVIKTIGITGTRGKSTVTHMLYDILKRAGEGVLLGGNVRGVSTLALLPEVKENSVALMELDSWQCQGFGDSGISPNIAVFTTFYDDHLNYYGGDREHYLKDKSNIFINQKPGDTFIVSQQALEFIQELALEPKEKMVVSADNFPNWELQIPGEHNKLNAVLALEAARAHGIDDEVTKESLENFKGVQGRLELIKELNGVKIYNDTTATSPDATVAALRALDNGAGNIVLIMGGTDKGLDMNQLLVEVPRHSKRVILLAGTGTDRVAVYLPEASVFDDLTKAVEEALNSAKVGDSILFSPAFASFGMFKNEYDRGDQFNATVEKLS